MFTSRTDDRRRLRARYGPWAVVTGASEGIGRAFAEVLAEAGFHLVLVARRRAVLQALADDLAGRHGVSTRVVAADLGPPAGASAVIEAAAEVEVGLLVAAAGFGTSGPFLGGTPDAELDMIDVNCRAVAALSHAFGTRFVRQGRGGLVLLSSLVAFQGTPRAANYAATKAYVQSLAEGLARELGALGVDVIACAPGPVDSGFASRADMVMSRTVPGRVVAEETLASLGRKGTVRPGLLSKILAASLALLPRAGRVRVMGLVMGGMTRHQASRRPAEGAGR